MLELGKKYSHRASALPQVGKGTDMGCVGEVEREKDSFPGAGILMSQLRM